MSFKDQRKILFSILLIVLFVVQGCRQNIFPSPSLGVSTATTIPKPTRAETLIHNIEPLVTGSILRFDSWSPDSKWFAYWITNNDDAPAHLAFINVQTGKTCEQEVGAIGIESGGVKWLADGTVNIADYSSKKAFHGVPCKTFSEVEFFPPSNHESSLSPDNRYRAETVISGYNQELTHNITAITEISTNQVIVTVNWDSGPHTSAESGWLTNELYLIGLDVVKQKVIYASVLDGKVGDVVTDIMRLKTQDVGYIFHMGRYANTTEGKFHLLLEEANQAPALLLLYHSETGFVEKLPFYKSSIIDGSAFSSDGKWLFLSYPSSKQNGDIPDFWIRSVDPPDSAALQLASGMGFAGFSSEAHKIVFIDDYVHILNFPSGEVISMLSVPDYSIDRVWWSPDGTRLALQGFPVSTQPGAIFVVEP